MQNHKTRLLKRNTFHAQLCHTNSQHFKSWLFINVQQCSIFEGILRKTTGFIYVILFIVPYYIFRQYMVLDIWQHIFHVKGITPNYTFTLLEISEKNLVNCKFCWLLFNCHCQKLSNMKFIRKLGEKKVFRCNYRLRFFSLIISGMEFD